jgi:hypothetical protein
LLTAMNAYFPAKIDSWGDVWDTAKMGGWGPATAFAPIVLSVDLFGYDAMSRMPEGWAERTRNTYKMQLPQAKPQWCSPAGMGYNQCYYVETSLLLDEMSDATNFVDWMARFCFTPRMPHPYRAPEGAVIASDKSVWRRWGDLGNLYQMSEVVYAIQIILGIDDLDASYTKLMPRIPVGWTSAEISGWPIRTMSSGESILARLSVNIKRDPACKKFDMKIATDKLIDKFKVRIGPFPKDASALFVKANGSAQPAQLIQSGDSKWAWIELRGATSFSIESRVK